MRSWLWWGCSGALVGLVVFACTPVGAAENYYTYADGSGGQWNTNVKPLPAQVSGSVVTVGGAAPSTGWRMPPASYSPGTTTGDMVVRDTFKAPSPKIGEVIDVQAKRAIPWASTARAVGRALPIISTAIAVKEIWDAIRCREAFGGTAECDEGQPEIPRTTWTAAASAFNCIGRTVNVAAKTGPSALSAGTSWVQSAATLCGYVNWGTVTISGGNVVSMTAQETWGQGRSIQVIPTSATAPGCPDVVVNGVTLTPVKGPDGKCMSNIYEPANPTVVGEKAEQYGDKTKAPALVPELVESGIPIEHARPIWDAPPVVQGDREVTTKPDGGKRVRDVDYPISDRPDGYDWRRRVTETDYPPGATIPEPGEPPTVPGTVTDSPGGGSTTEIETCGLPGKPPCKIDETGTPEWDKNDPQGDADAAIADWKACLLSPSTCVPALPSLNWSFEFPSTCAPIALPQFAELGFSELDICQWQPQIHDIMSMIWAAAGLFGAISMIGRDSAGGS